ncbi:MAG: DUF1178 family protein [Pseudomonadota bacterium]
MIRFALRCSKGHAFDAWFASNATFDDLRKAGALACAECGDPTVEKALMAPAVRTAETAKATAKPGGGAGAAVAPAGPAQTPPAEAPPSLTTPASPQEAMRAALRAKIEAVSDNVGRDFAAEARRIHAGEAPERPILGEASQAEAKALIEDDIPVMPLPWMSKRNA